MINPLSSSTGYCNDKDSCNRIFTTTDDSRVLFLIDGVDRLTDESFADDGLYDLITGDVMPGASVVASTSALMTSSTLLNRSHHPSSGYLVDNEAKILNICDVTGDGGWQVYLLTGLDSHNVLQQSRRFFFTDEKHSEDFRDFSTSIAFYEGDDVVRTPLMTRVMTSVFCKSGMVPGRLTDVMAMFFDGFVTTGSSWLRQFL